MVEEKRHGNNTKVVSISNFQRIKTKLSQGFYDQMPFPIFNLTSRQSFTLIVLLMAVMTENDEIIVNGV